MYFFSARSAGANICPEHALVTYCQDHASCIETNETFHCVCDNGFIASGSQCIGKYDIAVSTTVEDINQR